MKFSASPIPAAPGRRCVDLNCDLGEGAGRDAELMALVTSANIACGAHAGSRDGMRAAIALALRHGTAIGAHPGLPDREHFGRVELPITADDALRLVLDQVQLLQDMAAGAGGRIVHVKPHGALYGLASRDRAIADAVAEAVHRADPRLILIGLARGRLLDAGRAKGLRVASEVFADRTYQPDGSLTPRTQPNAVIPDAAAGAAQVLRLVREGRVPAVDGAEVAAEADTVCIHGDGPDPAGFARRLRSVLAAAGVEARPLADFIP